MYISALDLFSIFKKLFINSLRSSDTRFISGMSMKVAHTTFTIIIINNNN